MVKELRRQSRLDLLADVAELYYINNQNQTQIAHKMGVTRSMVSRMLTEARKLGLVKFQIERPYNLDYELTNIFRNKFDLKQAAVVAIPEGQPLLSSLGKVAARILIKNLHRNSILGTSWGTAISATVDEVTLPYPLSGIKVVQLLGAVGTRLYQYNGVSIVRRLEEKLDAEGIYLNAPYLVDEVQAASMLMKNRDVHEALAFGSRADTALLGIGSTDIDASPYFLAGFITEKELSSIQASEAVGDVCVLFFDINGKMCCPEFNDHTVGIRFETLIKIPNRIGVAGGPAKVKPLVGALTGGLINILITDSVTARAVLNFLNK
jgi:DNA-binding transcriptional regulator LsrR (DeoR family)